MRFRGMFLWAAAMVLFGCFFMFSQPALACGDSPPAKGDPVQIEALTPQAPVIMDTACVAVFNLQAPTNMDLVYVAAIPALPESRDHNPTGDIVPRPMNDEAIVNNYYRPMFSGP